MSKNTNKMNPFPGLRPFTQEEDYLFFGREEQTIELLQRLAGNRLVTVVGTSGSGKPAAMGFSGGMPLSSTEYVIAVCTRP